MKYQILIRVAPLLVAVLLAATSLAPKSVLAIDSKLATQCHVIDGPANLREQPDGKVLESIPMNASVDVLEKRGSWVRIQTFKGHDGKYACYAREIDPKIISGWTHEKNIKQMSLEDAAKIDACTIRFLPLKTIDSASTAKVKKETCSCAVVQDNYHDSEACSPVEFKKGDQVGAECSVSQDAVKCQAPRRGHFATYRYFKCPGSCLSISESKPLTVSDKQSALAKATKAQRESLALSAPASLMKALNQKSPKWLPYLKDKSNSQYQMDLAAVPFFARFEDPSAKPVSTWIVLFYESPDSFFRSELSWFFFREDSKPVSWSGKVPFNVNSAKGEDHAGFCVIAKTPIANGEPILVAEAPMD